MKWKSKTFSEGQERTAQAEKGLGWHWATQEPVVFCESFMCQILTLIVFL